MFLLDKLRGARSAATESSAPTVLIVGLGNPGREHAGHRHNVGWRVADRFVAARGWRFSKKQHDALLALGAIGATRVIVAKPQTFMNQSGRSVALLARFYQVPLDRLLALYDELDLPFGAIRLREKGGAGGHNGMRSLIERLGSGDFPRLRVGIGRPPGRMEPAAFVLRNFEPDEQAMLSDLLDRAAQAIELFVVEGIGAAMNQFNSTARKTQE